MTIESATYIKSLDAANPSGDDPLADADDHLRLIKAVLKATFPNLDAPVTATPAQLNSGIPIGGTILWPFPINTIPAGWAICNGQTLVRSDGLGNITTPNLLDKFVMGTTAADTEAFGSTGGAKSVTVSTKNSGAHVHDGGTDVRGAHSHGGATGIGSGGQSAGSGGSTKNTISEDGAHFHYFTTNQAGDHSHEVTITTLPPYVKYPYIMKV